VLRAYISAHISSIQQGVGTKRPKYKMGRIIRTPTKFQILQKRQHELELKQLKENLTDAELDELDSIRINPFQNGRPHRGDKRCVTRTNTMTRTITKRRTEAKSPYYQQPGEGKSPRGAGKCPHSQQPGEGKSARGAGKCPHSQQPGEGKRPHGAGKWLY
jgi:hypothetical protein